MQEGLTIIFSLGLSTYCLMKYFDYQKKRKRIIQNGIEAEGIVFDFSDESSQISINTNGRSASTPLIRFVTKEGVWITEKGEWSSTVLNQGDKVTVIYSPDNPKEFIFKTSRDWGGILMYLFLLMGVVSLIVGLWQAYQYLTKEG